MNCNSTTNTNIMSSCIVHHKSTFAFIALILISSYCGKTNGNRWLYQTHKSESKIVGGQDAERHYPYMVSLQVTTNDGETYHNCGASVLNSRHVLTAAHCVDGQNASVMSIVVGTNDLASNEGVRYKAESFLKHPEYVELNNSDIAIIKLTETIKFNDRVSPVVLETEYVNAGVRVLLTGWGFRTPVRIGGTPKKLQQTEFDTISNKDCSKVFSVTTTEVCAKDRIFKGACGVSIILVFE